MAIFYIYIIVSYQINMICFNPLNLIDKLNGQFLYTYILFLYSLYYLYPSNFHKRLNMKNYNTHSRKRVYYFYNIQLLMLNNL